MSECKHEWSKGKMFYGKSDCPYCEIDRLKAELVKWKELHDSEITRSENLERQLAEARAEIAALNDAKVTHYICGAADARQQSRQEAAREIIQYIEDQGKVSFGSIMNRDIVCDIDDRDIAKLKQHFGLEG